MDQAPVQPAPKPTFGQRMALAFERLRNSAGIFRTEAIGEIENGIGELDARVAALEAKLAPAAPVAPAAPIAPAAPAAPAVAS